jgi:hypothetical protein
LASNKEGAGVVWDGLGLAERDRLVFGGAAAGRSATRRRRRPRADPATPSTP